MGAAKRRKMTGNYPEQTPKRKPKARKNILVTGHGGIGTMAAVMALLGQYPKLPGLPRRNKQTEEKKNYEKCPGCGWDMEEHWSGTPEDRPYMECPNPNCDWFEDEL